MPSPSSEPPSANSKSAQLAFTPVRLKRGFEEIYEQIRAEIASGRLGPGDRLPSEREMASMFGVSRQAVREALRGLEISGLVVSKVGVTGGAFVREGDTSVVMRNLKDLAFLGQLSPGSLLEARILLTSDALRLVCAHGTEEDLDELERDTDRIELLSDAGQREERAALRTNFYKILARATHNEVFELLIDALTDIVQLRLLAVRPDPRDDIAAVRRKIIAALRERDADEAVAEMTAHFERLEEFLISEESKRVGQE